MSKSIDPKELVLMQNFPPDVWQTVVVCNNGEIDHGDFMSQSEVVLEYVQLQAEVEEGDQVYVQPVWNMYWHKEEVTKLMEEGKV